MSAVHPREIRRALRKKGFREDKTHHYRYWFFDGERKTSVKTFVSHSDKDYNDHLLSKVAAQIGLRNKQQLLDLVNCPLDKEGYTQHLLQTGRLVRK